MADFDPLIFQFLSFYFYSGLLYCVTLSSLRLGSVLTRCPPGVFGEDPVVLVVVVEVVIVVEVVVVVVVLRLQYIYFFFDLC